MIVVADAYAYTPYGRLLMHTGSSRQPFTFVGRYGVRQVDDAGTLYDMGARCYDAATAQFLSRAPVQTHLALPKTLNPYQYALENPVGPAALAADMMKAPY